MLYGRGRRGIDTICGRSDLFELRHGFSLPLRRRKDRRTEIHRLAGGIERAVRGGLRRGSSLFADGKQCTPFGGVRIALPHRLPRGKREDLFKDVVFVFDVLRVPGWYRQRGVLHRTAKDHGVGTAADGGGVLSPRGALRSVLQKEGL